MTKPSIIGVSGRYSSVANSARSPWAKSTGVVCVWNPRIEENLVKFSEHVFYRYMYTFKYWKDPYLL